MIEDVNISCRIQLIYDFIELLLNIAFELLLNRWNTSMYPCINLSTPHSLFETFVLEFIL